MAKPFVSFCFSTFNRPVFLKSTLTQLMMQTFKDFEVIISDNDPEESGRTIASSMNDSRIRYFANGENLGMKKSYNKSLERSSGEFIVMIADDDPVYPDMLSTLHGLQQSHPGFGMYMGGCDWYCMDHKLGKLYNLKVGTNSCLSNDHNIGDILVFNPSEFIKKIFSFSIFPHYLWSTCMVKREILVQLGGVPEYGTAFLGDYAYMAISSSVSGCVVINKSLGCQTLHDENFGRNQSDQVGIAVKNFPLFLKNKISHLPEWPDIEKNIRQFVGLWAVSHLSFLYKYSGKVGRVENNFTLVEKDVFNDVFARKFKTKYYLKTRFPAIHDGIVQIKKRFK
jgi:glycosyltransferase involved in cell wall biosynthesis